LACSVAGDPQWSWEHASHSDQPDLGLRIRLTHTSRWLQRRRAGRHGFEA